MRHRRAFTLIELLCVLCITAALVALLMPVLSVATGAARDIQCLAQLRQAGNAISAYAVDGNQQYPPNRFNGGYWFEQQNAGSYLPETAADAAGRALACPNDRLAKRTYCMNNWASSNGFGTVDIDNPPPGVAGAFFDADVKEASRIILVGEGWAKWDDPGSYTADPGFGDLGDRAATRFTGDVGNAPGGRYTFLPNQINWTLHGDNDDPTRAQGSALFAYADGHAATKQHQDLVDAQTDISTFDSMWSPIDPELVLNRSDLGEPTLERPNRPTTPPPGVTPPPGWVPGMPRPTR